MWWQMWVLLADWQFLGWYFSGGQTLSPNDRAVVQKLARGFAGQTGSKMWVRSQSGEIVEESGWTCPQPMGVSGLEWSEE